MNNVVLIGRLTKDAEVRQTQSGTSVASFTVAVNRRFKNSEGKYDADFINCVAWRQTAEFVSKYFSKGSQIALNGSLQTSTYEVEGVKRYKTEVIVDNVEFVGSKTDSPKKETNEMNPDEMFGNGFVPADDADLPF